MPQATVAPPETATEKPKLDPQQRPKTKKLPPYNVVLLDDDHHTYDYVIEMLQNIFAHPRGKAYKMACEVDSTGRVIVFTGHQEVAELKRDQIHGYGTDFRIARCKGSMRATVEPAEIG